ncbi:MAG TPA: hypothetical protein VGG62_05260 [Terracidiphilus sp.]
MAVSVTAFLPIQVHIAQEPGADTQRLVESGQVVVDGQRSAYLIRRLPVSSFPDLPPAVADLLSQRDCLVPQTYAAHHPENVVHASLERSGSSDWAVLCSAQGTVSLLVFFGSTSGRPIVLSSAPETKRLQRHDSTGVLGFNWAIDPAPPETVRRAQGALQRKSPPPDHDAVADSVVEHGTVYRIYTQHAWTVVETKD